MIKYVNFLFINDQFYGEDGWGREPLTNYLKNYQDVVKSIFPKANQNLSLMAYVDSLPIGECKHNYWLKYREKLRMNIMKSYPENNDIYSFISMLKFVLQTENIIENLLNEKGISSDKIVHNAGIMVLKKYECRGIAQQMVKESIKLLKSKGFKAIICETTNVISAQVMIKNKFIKFIDFDYKDFNINIDDKYSIWYRLINERKLKKVAILIFNDSKNMCSDSQYLKAPFLEHGLVYEEIIWDNSIEINWQEFSAVVIRSTCDYFMPEKYALFMDLLKKIDDMGIPLHNPLEIINWNSKKTYLEELERKGVYCLETIYAKIENIPSISDLMDEKKWSACVIKPAISAGSYKTFYIDKQSVLCFDLAKYYASDELLLIQQFAPEITQEGEYSLIFIDMQFSHCILKKPKNNDFRVQHFHGGSQKLIYPDPLMVTYAKQILEIAGFKNLLYSRVDMIRRNNHFFLMELELIEPDLFFNHNPDASISFTQALCRRLKK